MSIIEIRGMCRLELPELTRCLYHAGTIGSPYYSNRYTIEDSMTQTVLYYDKDKNNLISFEITMQGSYGYTENGEVVESVYELFNKDDFERYVTNILNTKSDTYIEVSVVPDIEDGTNETTIDVYDKVLKGKFYGSLIGYFKLKEKLSKSNKKKFSYVRI